MPSVSFGQVGGCVGDVGEPVAVEELGDALRDVGCAADGVDVGVDDDDVGERIESVEDPGNVLAAKGAATRREVATSDHVKPRDTRAAQSFAHGIKRNATSPERDSCGSRGSSSRRLRRLLRHRGSRTPLVVRRWWRSRDR